MPAYLVTLNREKSGQTLKAGADAMVVFAASDTIAKQAAAAKFSGDGGQAWITDGTATEIVAGSLVGYTFRVHINGPDVNATVELVAAATATDTMDEIGAALKALLNAVDGIAGADYNASTNVLKVAETTDGIGDHAVAVEIIAPGSDEPIPGLVGTITHKGSAGSALSVELPADAVVVPNVAAVLKQVA